MRQALESRLTRARVARAGSLPAPTGGWDAQHPLADMPEENAIILDNFIPRPGYVELRRGYIPQVNGFTATVQELLTWRGPAGDKLLACTATSLYDVTTASSLGTPLYTAATSARWVGVSFANDAGQFTVAANGVDTPIRFDGTTVTALSITGTSGPITLDPKKLFTLTAHKSRLHFAEAASLRVWFLGLSDVDGAAQLLDLGPVFSKGGALAAMGTWSFATGSSVDEYVCYVTTQGQVAVYGGLDPSDATNWSLVSVFDLAPPLGPKALIKYGSDLAVITVDGVVPLSQAIQQDRAKDNDVALTQRIQNAFLSAASSYKGNFGWAGVLYPRGSLAIVNVPVVELGTAWQFVQNLQTGAWCRFIGLDASAWALANDRLYFASGTGVYQWDQGASDFGTPITADLKSAFSAFGSRPSEKRFTLLRPLLSCPGYLRPALDVCVDYAEAVPAAQPSVVDPANLKVTTRTDWDSVAALGYVGAVRMRVVLNGFETTALALDSGDVDELTSGDGYPIMVADPVAYDASFQLYGFDLQFEPGGLL